MEILPESAEEEDWAVCSPSSGLQDTKYTISGLHGNKEYKIRVRAVNEAGPGEFNQLAQLYQPKDVQIAPEIETDPHAGQYITVKAGAAIRMFCAIRGRPAPAVKWTKENGDINPNALTDTNDFSTSLLIDKCTRDDAGR